MDESSLRSFPLRRRLIDRATVRDLAAGDRLQEPLLGDPWAILVLAGVVRLYLSTGTAEPTIVLGGHGALLGTHTSMGRGGASQLGLQAVTPSRILQVDSAAVAGALNTSGRSAMAVLDDSRREIRDLVELNATRWSASLGQRLAHLLLVISQLERFEPLLGVTEEQLAIGIGSIRESVARSLADLRREGWIATTRHGVILLDTEALRRYADIIP